MSDSTRLHAMKSSQTGLLVLLSVLALFAAHGPAIESWPRDVLAALELGRA